MRARNTQTTGVVGDSNLAGCADGHRSAPSAGESVGCAGLLLRNTMQGCRQYCVYKTKDKDWES